MKTLIVEDEFTGRALLLGILGGFGDCHVAINAEEAIEAFMDAMDASAPYDLICMDIHLPGMNGIEAVRRIRSVEEQQGITSTHGVKILMTTAADEPREIIEAYRALCDEYLTKPISAAALIAKLKSIGLPN